MSTLPEPMDLTSNMYSTLLMRLPGTVTSRASEPPGADCHAVNLVSANTVGL